MEELLVIIVQFLFEFIIELLLNIPFDWPSKYRRTPEPDTILLRCMFWFAGGCALAGASLLLVGHTLISAPELRIVNLLVAPLASGLLSQAIAKHRATQNALIVPRNHFWQAFWFTLGLVIIRFIYATRI